MTTVHRFLVVLYPRGATAPDEPDADVFRLDRELDAKTAWQLVPAAVRQRAQEHDAELLLLASDVSELGLGDYATVTLLRLHNAVRGDRPHVRKFQDRVTAIRRTRGTFQAWVEARELVLGALPLLGAVDPDYGARAPRRAIDPEARVTVLVENPKRAGSASRERFDLYGAVGTTSRVADLLAAGLTAADLRWDESHKFIRLGDER